MVRPRPRLSRPSRDRGASATEDALTVGAGTGPSTHAHHAAGQNLDLDRRRLDVCRTAFSIRLRGPKQRLALTMPTRARDRR